MNITFRLERPGDHYAVEAMTREAFWHFWEPDREICDEHLLVHKLRHCPALIPELNLVAELDGKVAGHIIYTASHIKTADGKTAEVITFGPLTVLPEHQGRGIGRALMFYSFEEAKKLGHRAVVIYGIPDYYPRVGFRRGAGFGLTDAEGKAYDAFMVYPLYDGALDGLHGSHHYHPVYESLTQEEALEFDRKFPPKEPHVPVPIEALLKRLPPDAARAVRGQNLCSFDILKSRSEREVAALPGMDGEGIETVRAMMAECGYPWGEPARFTED
jgi:predicted N-acetyltransferase YhbS